MLAKFKENVEKLNKHLKETNSPESKKLLDYWKNGRKKLPKMFKKKKEITRLLSEAL